jgi:hypothetical protein
LTDVGMIDSKKGLAEMMSRGRSAMLKSQANREP